MPIVLMRVDNRFIHGQILEGWLPLLQADELIIANDEVSGSDTQRRILETALTYPIGLLIDTVDRVINLLLQAKATDPKRIVLVSHPVDVLRMKRAGVEFDRLVLGNVMAKTDPVALSDRVILGPAGREALKEILAEGIVVHVQGVPSDEPMDLTKICSCL